MGATILVVDDDAAVVDMLAELLESEGYRVLTAGDAATAAASVARERPALALVDHMMPGMTGAELVAHLRASSAAGVPAILMSAASRVPLPPATPFLPKPFDLGELLAAVAAALPAR